MILFSEDYGYYPRAIIDFNTTNKSFVQLAMLYRDMGIKNNAFHLTLLNPELSGVDPFSKELTKEQIIMITAEVKSNPWYFLREIARAPAKAGLHPTKVRANRSNIALFWLFLNHCQIILVQPRQTGKSFNTDILMVWLLLFRCDNTEINLLTKDDILRRTNVQRLKDIMTDLPEYLQIRNKYDSNNSEEISVNARGNKYNTHLPQASAKRAINLGRGLTTPIVHIDEGPFCPNIGLSIPAMLAAMGAAIEAAKANDSPYGVIFTTTAGKKDDSSGAFIYKLITEAAVLNEPLMYDCKDQDELIATVRKLSKKNGARGEGVYRVNATFSHRQLGYDDAWLKQRMEEALSEGEDANRDFFNIWTSGSEKSPFGSDVAEAIASSETPPLYTDISEVGRFVTNWWLEEHEIELYMRNNVVIFGLDASEAIGKDDITLYMQDPKNVKTIATGVFNDTNVLTVAEHICKLMLKYPNLVGIIESKNMGVAILDLLLLKLPTYGHNPFKRLFNRVVQEAEDNEIKMQNYEEVMRYGKNSQIINKYRSSFGFSTSGSGNYSRDSLYGSAFKVALSKSKNFIYDNTLVKELLTLVIKNGRIDHEIGGHDDMVISWLLCWWLLINGKQLSSYGIDSRNIMVQDNFIQNKSYTPEEIMFELEQQDIRNEMTEIYNSLSNEDDDFVAQKLEQRLRVLNNRIVLRPEETYSIDNLINETKKIRKQRKKRLYSLNY